MEKNFEDERLALQAALDSEKSSAERNQMGQFATPTGLAREILDFAVGLLPADSPVRFFDPAIGTGSFYSALRHTTPEPRIERAEGYEIDPHYARPAKKLWKGTTLRVHEADFTRANTKSPDDLPNLLICNPPYVRHHHMENAEKLRLQEVAESACGVRIGGLAGLYCYFLAISHQWMSEGGVAAWLIPSEFMDVNYGRAVKDYLLGEVELVRIHRFDPNDVQFSDALVSSAVLFLRKSRPDEDRDIEFTFGGTIREPRLTRQVPASALRVEPKWTRFPVADVREAHTGSTLGDLFRIKRGIATGDNKFFILSREHIQERDLPWQFFRPILPSARYVKDSHIRADEDGNPAIERQLFLLDCRLPEDEVRLRFPSLWRYLQEGVPDVASRYLCRTRKSWYSQEDRPPAPFLCTYLGRSDGNGRKPFRFFLNESNAIAANVYLMLYPQPLLAARLAAKPSLAEAVWKFLNQIDPNDLLGEGRVYGGGLHKLEPKELANVPSDTLLEMLGISLEEQREQGDLFGQKVA